MARRHHVALTSRGLGTKGRKMYGEIRGGGKWRDPTKSKSGKKIKKMRY